MSTVTVLGSVNVDLVVKVPSLPAAGETVLGDRLLTVGGGKGANQAAAAARLGARVRMVARFGDDAFGQQLLEELEGDDIDVLFTFDAGAPSGAALILVDDRGQNIVAVAPGANARVDAGDVGRFRRLLRPGDVAVLQLEIPIEAVDAAVTAARDARAVVVLNAAPADALIGRQPPEVDVLILNEGEARALTGDEDVASAAARLAERGGSVIVTLGERGALLRSEAGSSRIDAFPVKAVDTTAAGDAFVGGVAAGLSFGLPLAEAVRLGSAAGAAAATKVGARDSLPYADDLIRMFGIDVATLRARPRP
jgi:ribokinase